MPHKHRRKQNDETDYELPPDFLAKPLAVSKFNEKSKGSGNASANSKKRKRAGGDDDTPKEFLRLMQRMKPKSAAPEKPSPGDAAKKRKKNKDQRGTSTDREAPNKRQKKEDGGSDNKDSKRKGPAPKKTSQTAKGDDGGALPATAASSEPPAPATTVVLPTIQPGERMADFSARVDQALPLMGLVSKGKGRTEAVPGLKRGARTKLERRITRMQDEWRERERRYQQKRADAEEDEEIEAVLNGEDKGRVFRILDRRDVDGDEEQAGTGGGKGKKKKKGRRKKGNGADDDDDDPWAALAKSRKLQEGTSKGLVGVHDVVQAPPRFDVQPKEIFKIRDVET